MRPLGFDDYLLNVLAVLVSLACVGAVVLVVFFTGYAVGLWSAPCQIARHQPKCVKAGWGQDIRIERQR